MIPTTIAVACSDFAVLERPVIASIGMRPSGWRLNPGTAFRFGWAAVRENPGPVVQVLADAAGA
jgi:hypothetical protein